MLAEIGGVKFSFGEKKETPVRNVGRWAIRGGEQHWLPFFVKGEQKRGV